MRGFFVIWCLLTLPMLAVSLPSEKRKNAKLFQKVLSPVQQALQDSSAVFYDDEDRVSFIFGTVVSADGLILTKASELKEVANYHVRVGKKKYGEVQFIASDHRWDLALVKVDAEGLTPVKLEGSSDLEHGTWLVSNGASKRRFRRPRAGILSANKREVKGHSLAVIGIIFVEKDGELVVTEVSEGGGAEAAGLVKGDRILVVDGKEIDAKKPFVEYLKQRKPGEKIELKVGRGEEELDLEVEMFARHEVFGGPQNRNDSMSGDFSPRRTNFPMVLQHETTLSRRTVGGPLFTLDSQFVGMNIAAVNRVENYAIPVEELKVALEDLRKQGATGEEPSS